MMANERHQKNTRILDEHVRNDYELWLVFVLIGYREMSYSKVKTRNDIYRSGTNGDMTHNLRDEDKNGGSNGSIHEVNTS